MADYIRPSQEDKIDDSRKTSISPQDNKDESPARLEKGTEEFLVLNEEEALARARAHPNSTVPIYLTFRVGHDPSNPRHWPAWKRWYTTFFACWLNVMTCLCAGGYSSGSGEMVKEFGVSAEVGTLCLSLYILGFAVGPMVLAPLSEYYGRRPVYLASWFVLFIFQLPVALAPNIGTVIVCRLIQGLGGSAPLANTGGTVSDCFSRNESGYAMLIYGLSSTFGPPFALVISGYVAQNLGWRALFWFFMIVTGVHWIVMIVTHHETRHSIILEKKAKRVRQVLSKEGSVSAATIAAISDIHNKGHKRSMHRLFATNLSRPFRFLATEPITMGAAAYNGLLYGIVYIFNEAFPLVFGPGGHNFNTGEWGLSFLGLCVGALLAACLHPLQERYYLRRVAQNEGKGVPEARMWQARYAAFVLPISLFWFAWTSFPRIYWLVPIIASVFFGGGLYIIILGILSYVVDSYQTYSASALAGVILIRNLVGAGFPLFASQMYHKLGNEWASTLLGFLALLFAPIPIWWFYRGEQLRLKSPWAREHFYQDEDAPH